MSNDEAVEAFLEEADDVLGEYEQGYMDADAALSRLTGSIEDLRDEYDEP
ncbi:hypothetical protein [Halorarum halobium]|nr:hypothetical protein [Halobaculum sp. XH14]